MQVSAALATAAHHICSGAVHERAPRVALKFAQRWTARTQPDGPAGKGVARIKKPNPSIVHISKKEDYALEPNLKVHDERDDGAEAYERRVLLPRDHQTKLLRAPLVLARLGPERLRRLHERVEALALSTSSFAP